MTETIRVGIQDEEIPLDEMTVMSDLREALATSVEVEDIRLDVPKRPNVRMVFRPVIDFDQLKLWTKRAKESNRKDAPVDQKKLSSMILIETCVGMDFKLRDGSWRESVNGADNRPLTFKSREVHEMMGTTIGGNYHAVEKMYGSDGHLMYVAKIVMEAAGYADFDLEAGESDPLES
jgi:hypothetical protein